LAQGRSLGRRRETSPLTEVHRPRARQAVDVVGAPAYDPKRSFRGSISRALPARINDLLCCDPLAIALTDCHFGTDEPDVLNEIPP
jgi:hypothetical protein